MQATVIPSSVPARRLPADPAYRRIARHNAARRIAADASGAVGGLNAILRARHLSPRDIEAARSAVTALASAVIALGTAVGRLEAE